MTEPLPALPSPLMSAEDEAALEAELHYGSTLLQRRPIRRPGVAVEIVREATEGDIQVLNAALPERRNPLGTLLRVKAAHHQLARLLATGMPPVEAANVTGYSPDRIRSLQNDPAFRELLAYYVSQSEIIFVDTLERMKTLGLTALDEIQHRLEEEPDGWTKTELKQLAESFLLRVHELQAKANQGAGNAAGAPAPGVSIEVNFVTSKNAGNTMVDVTPSRPKREIEVR